VEQEVLVVQLVRKLTKALADGVQKPVNFSRVGEGVAFLDAAEAGWCQ
jgi:hypothetical protein